MMKCLLRLCMLCLVAGLGIGWNQNGKPFNHRFVTSIKSVDLQTQLLGRKGIVCLLISSLFVLSPVALLVDRADAAQQIAVDFNDLNRLKRGLKEVNYLLDHWEEKTTYCNFGEFQRELLLPENKEKLMAAAAEFSLFDYDKSKTMNVMCRQDPQVVRAFLGLTPENPLLNRADALMKQKQTLNLVDPDDFDQYIEAVDVFSQAVAAVDGLAYNARTDFAATETSKKGDNSAVYSNKNDYLAQAKGSVFIARDSLAKVIEILHI